MRLASLKKQHKKSHLSQVAFLLNGIPIIFSQLLLRFPCWSGLDQPWCDHNAHIPESFYSYACATLGEKKASILCALTGYQALKSPKMSVSTALEIIHSHPESLFSNKQEGNWHSIFRGFRKLIESLVHRLEKAGVHFFNLFKFIAINCFIYLVDISIVWYVVFRSIESAVYLWPRTLSSVSQGDNAS